MGSVRIERTTPRSSAVQAINGNPITCALPLSYEPISASSRTRTYDLPISVGS